MKLTNLKSENKKLHFANSKEKNEKFYVELLTQT